LTYAITIACRYDLSHVDVVEAVAAEGLATFGGCLPDGAARQLEELLLSALRNGLGYRGRDKPWASGTAVLHHLPAATYSLLLATYTKSVALHCS
jgi:hypothetical protein